MSKSKFVNFNELDDLDIVFFHGTGYWFSYIIEWFTGSPISHVGIILKDPTYINPNFKGTYILESGIEPFPDAENNKYKFGVQINSLDEVLDKLNGYSFVRKLEGCTLDKKIIKNKLKIIHDLVHDKPYDYLPTDLLNALLKVDHSDTHKLNKFFCSALVAYVYTKMGILPSDFEWSLTLPRFFDSPLKDTLLLGSELSDKLSIKKEAKVKSVIVLG